MEKRQGDGICQDKQNISQGFMLFMNVKILIITIIKLKMPMLLVQVILPFTCEQTNIDTVAKKSRYTSSNEGGWNCHFLVNKIVGKMSNDFLLYDALLKRGLSWCG